MKFGNLLIRCKKCDNGIEKYNLERFQIIEPQNEKELSDILNQNFPTYIDAFVYMPCTRYEFLDSSIFQNLPKKTFDWLCIDIHGTILSINKNIKPNQEIHLAKNTFAIIVSKPGLSERHKINIDDWVIYKNFVAPKTL